MTIPEPYRACSIKRSRRTKAAIEKIQADICDLLEADHPMTVRQIFYRLVVRGTIEKTEEQYQGTAIRLLTDMRMSGAIPFDWIIDESRRRRITQTYDNLAEALEKTARFYRRSALHQADDYIEIWCEKEALSAAIWEVTSEYDVPLIVSKGMPSLTLLYGTAVQIFRAAEAGKVSHLYQFGDHDPSGVLIPHAIERRLDQLCEQLGCAHPYFQRVALTEAHIAAFDLPTRPTKREGNRHANGFKGDSVELDALPPSVLRDMVREVIERHISPTDVEILRAAEQSERQLLRAWTAERAP